jgi:hypothetical protein
MPLQGYNFMVEPMEIAKPPHKKSEKEESVERMWL